MYVYFIRTMKSPRRVKVGKAKHPEQRLKTLQTGNPVELKLIGKIRCQSDKHALEIEKLFHQKFKKYRIRGEWFKHADYLISQLYEFITIHDNATNRNKL